MDFVHLSASSNWPRFSMFSRLKVKHFWRVDSETFKLQMDSLMLTEWSSKVDFEISTESMK